MSATGRAVTGQSPGSGRALRALVLLALLVLVWTLPDPRAAQAAGSSLRFYGNGTGDVDRVKIRIDGPARPADVGATDFTLEWWMKAAPGDNAATVTCDASDGWITGNIVFDRDIYGSGDYGDFGIALTAGRVAFGVSRGGNGTTLCGTRTVADGQWHHVAVTRRALDGLLRIFVDGALDAEGTGPSADVSYRDGRATSYPSSDPFLVIGAEKHDAGAAYPSYRGWIDEVRLSRVIRYTASFARPSGPFAPDPSTAGLYHLDEGAGDAVADTSGAVGGPSQGERRFGGTPAGPVWSADTPFSGPVPGFGLQLVASALASPAAVANAGDGSKRLFIVEQAGRIRVHTGAVVLPTPFLDIAGRVLAGGERGLLGLAFHPGYAANGFFFVYYTSRPNGDIVIARYSVTSDPNVADPSSELVLLTIPHPSFSNHNGGALAFGPDGCLYAGVGDGGGAGDPNNNAQNLGVLLGKLVRIDAVSGAPCSAPPGNPFIGTPGARGEIWALGLRNPWRITLDRQTGDLLIADVGQGSREEVDFQPGGTAGGQNYCWKRKEGTLVFDPSVPCTTGVPTEPVLEYAHTDGNCSITGGYRYRGTQFPALAGLYLYGDFCSGRIWGATAGGTWSTTELLDTALSISTFGEDEDGELYVAHLSANAGALYRLVVDDVLAGAVLPASRSVQVGRAATAFATIINTGAATATACGLAPRTPVTGAFLYQTTDPATNLPVGTPNTPVDIPPGGAQTYVFGITPSAAIPATEIALAFDCTSTAPARVIAGVNTLLLSASPTAVPDVIALAATQGGQGIVDVPGATGTGLFAAASSNVGVTGTITVSADTGGVAVPVTLTVCETNPATGACLGPPTPTVTVAYAGGTNRSFAVFVRGSGPIAFDPAVNRIFVRFQEGPVTRGATSVAVRTQ